MEAIYHVVPRLAGLLAPALLGAALGCREDAESPMAPGRGPALETAAVPALEFRWVSAGGHHSCGVATDGRTYCWGRNDRGQLGDGTTTDHLQPVPVATELVFLSVSAGGNHTCAFTAFPFRAYCWGSNLDGQLGDGTTRERRTPVPVAGGHEFQRVSAGDRHTCAVTWPQTARRVWCWGSNVHGQLGDGTTIRRLEPVEVDFGRTLHRVTAGARHTCAVGALYKPYCWGDNDHGQLGDGTTTDHVVPRAVAGGLSIVLIRAGASHSCATTRDHQAYCWGENRSGQLGDGTTTERPTPVPVAGEHLFHPIGAGDRHTCAVTHPTDPVAVSRLYCWGSNLDGQLGDGTTNRHLVPELVATVRKFHEVIAGDAHTCALTPGRYLSPGVAYCWGDNAFGQLGDGTTADRKAPVPVGGGT